MKYSLYFFLPFTLLKGPGSMFLGLGFKAEGLGV